LLEYAMNLRQHLLRIIAVCEDVAAKTDAVEFIVLER
jgi:hypothetical protein